MIAAFATDDLALFRCAFGGMVIPDHLYGGVICLGTRRSELNLADLAVAPCWWRRFDQHFCKVNCRIDSLPRKAVIKWQGPQLCNGCLDELRRELGGDVEHLGMGRRLVQEMLKPRLLGKIEMFDMLETTLSFCLPRYPPAPLGPPGWLKVRWFNFRS